MISIDGAPILNGEKEMKEYSIQEISPLGFGNPMAKISYDKNVNEDPGLVEIANAGAEIIKSGECMRKITDNDDGCIDGRKANKLLYLQGIEGEDFNEIDIQNPTEHQRAKVAGGGYMTALSMKIALSKAHGTVEGDLTSVAEHLTEQGLYCGTHTGPHLNESCADCGANDRFQEIIDGALRFKNEINQTVDAILKLTNSESIDEKIISEVNQGFSSASDNNEYFGSSTGLSRFKSIMKKITEAQKTSGIHDEPVAVSKNLDGNHQEAFIILNMVEDETFSQADFKEIMATKFPEIPEDKLPQAFVVDIPRIVKLARAMAHGRDDQEADFRVALYAGLAFQFATAATLTDGSLRNFIIQ